MMSAELCVSAPSERNVAAEIVAEMEGSADTADDSDLSGAIVKTGDRQMRTLTIVTDISEPCLPHADSVPQETGNVAQSADDCESTTDMASDVETCERREDEFCEMQYIEIVPRISPKQTEFNTSSCSDEVKEEIKTEPEKEVRITSLQNIKMLNI